MDEAERSPYRGFQSTRLIPSPARVPVLLPGVRLAAKVHTSQAGPAQRSLAQNGPSCSGNSDATVTPFAKLLQRGTPEPTGHPVPIAGNSAPTWVPSIDRATCYEK